MSGIQLVTQRKKQGVELNMSPLIDMVFILLIFFLVTTSFVKETGVEVKRPIASDTSTPADKANLFIVVDRDGYIFIEDQMVDIRTVRSHVERWFVENPLGNVIITSDRGSRWGVSIEVLDKVREVGITNVVVTQALD
jgi:biopolymer transport protein ExbD